MRDCLTLCGDVHGNISAYIDLIKNSRFSIQLGDLGFNYKLLTNISSKFHKILAGNHDNYTIENNVFIKQTSHFLGDFGIHNVDNIGSFFFVRGGQSIDKHMRLIGYDWWPEEEMSYGKCVESLSAYEKAKPEYVISHECPESLIKLLCEQPFPPSRTACLLQSMFEIHQPKYWFFGHYHKSWDMMVNNTNFRCLNELEVFDIPYGGLK